MSIKKNTEAGISNNKFIENIKSGSKFNKNKLPIKNIIRNLIKISLLKTDTDFKS